MFHSLPPAGNPILLKSELLDKDDLANLFNGWRVHYYASGAMALAAGILAVKHIKKVISPEVIIPAYTCPEVVSAIIFAGATPVLVDFIEDKPWISIDDLQNKISSKTIAIIAVDMLGIPERLEVIKDIASNKDLILIEDSAQFFPREISSAAWKGDLVILSFGRGKPVSLLGGGAILSRPDYAGNYDFRIPKQETGSRLLRMLTYKLKVRLYNILLRPSLYWFPSSLPVLNIGETVYRPMDELSSFPQENASLLTANIRSYLGQDRGIQDGISSVVAKYAGEHIVDLPADCDALGYHLTRYPILAMDDGSSTDLLKLLSRKGLGASPFYKNILPWIKGINGEIRFPGRYPNAESFAKRLITLPTHQYVRTEDISALDGVLEKYTKMADERA